MSANLRSRRSAFGAEATGRATAALALAVAMALGGCAMNGDQPGGGDAAVSSAGSCEQRYEQAKQECQLMSDPGELAEVQACRSRALEEYQVCRGG